MSPLYRIDWGLGSWVMKIYIGFHALLGFDRMFFFVVSQLWMIFLTVLQVVIEANRPHCFNGFDSILLFISNGLHTQHTRAYDDKPILKSAGLT